MAPASRSSRWPIVAAAVASIALVAATILTRAGHHGPEPAARPAAAAPDPARVSATGSAEPAAGDRGEVAATRVAVGIATATQQWMYLTDDEITRAVEQAATPEAGPWLAEETVADVRSAREQLGASPGRVWWLVRPLATRVDHADADTARVSVWVVTVLSAAEVAAPQSEWMTVTVDLAWTAQGWRVSGVDDEAGPTPMTGPHDTPWDAVPFDEGLDGFVRLDGDPMQAPGAVG